MCLQITTAGEGWRGMGELWGTGKMVVYVPDFEPT